MRIISGKYRGKKLKEFDLTSTRPTLDRVKESIFNLVQFEVQDAVVLDLFSGTGALGIESISRGAKNTFLVDHNPKAIEIIKQNLLGIDGEYSVCQMDYLSFLKSNNQKFDLVFLDPPFKTDLGINAIDNLVKNDRINLKGIIIFETSNENDFDFDYENFEITRRKYGSVAVYKFVKVK